MTGRYRRRFHVTFWSLCCLLFSQWAVATHVCAAFQPALGVQHPMQLAAALATQADALAVPPCHGDPAAFADELPDESAAVCMKHCADERGATGNGVSVAAAATAPPSVMRTLVLDTSEPVSWAQPPAATNAAAPPLSILYCVFLT